MNGILTMSRLTTIKLHNIFIVGVSLLIAASFWVFPVGKNRETVFNYQLFQTNDGWGYDILVNDSICIHQDCMPGNFNKKAFPEKQQAAKAAGVVVRKLREGKSPAISREELQTIIAANE